MLIRPNFVQAPSVKLLINIGSLLDIPTGFYLKGKYGENVLNGGLGPLTGVVGIANNFKSTLLHYMMLSAAAKVHAAHETSMTTYDTEGHIHEHHLRNLSKIFDIFKDKDIIEEGIWTITDRTIYFANEWFEILKTFLKEKIKSHKSITLPTPFLDRDNTTLMSAIVPTFSEIDSLTDFETEDVAKIKDDNELGDSGGNTIHMRQGLAKLRFLMELPTLSGKGNHFFLLTAQLGKEGPVMSTGPIPAAPIKKLQHLKNGDKIKGTTDRFTFLMSNCWNAYNAAPFVNPKTKEPEYPRDSDDNKTENNDLSLVSLRQLRSKSGPSGIVVDLLVSQSEGVLPSLSEFHYIKGKERFGIEGTLQHYSLELLPEVSLSRTTIRTKINENPKLRRALNITAELCQMKYLWRQLPKDLLCTPKELYDDLKAKGYDWNLLLETRGWWTFNNDRQPVPFLSTMDLLEMRQGTYFPYWMTENKTGIKPEFQFT